MERLSFIKDNSTGIEIVSMEQVDISYPPHTHTGHYVFGIVTEGCIAIEIDGDVKECGEGQYFSVYPNICHSIKPVTVRYSAITTCIPMNDDISGELDII